MMEQHSLHTSNTLTLWHVLNPIYFRLSFLCFFFVVVYILSFYAFVLYCWVTVFVAVFTLVRFSYYYLSYVRAGTSVEASVWRGELFPLSCPKAVGCHSESFSNGDNGWGWGGVLCIVFYVCLLVLYLLYIIIIIKK